MSARTAAKLELRSGCVPWDLKGHDSLGWPALCVALQRLRGVKGATIGVKVVKHSRRFAILATTIGRRCVTSVRSKV